MAGSNHLLPETLGVMAGVVALVFLAVSVLWPAGAAAAVVLRVLTLPARGMMTRMGTTLVLSFGVGLAASNLQ